MLDELAEQGHDLPKKILEWRQVSKLKSTYTDALPTYVHPQTHRVHTTYALAATTTGRLSSNEPNLQNIPVRTEDGRKIRRAFIASKGHKLVSADYSQIELRLLAEIADIPVLKQAFRDGLDIHAMTASEMFGVPIKDMPSEVRRRAKAINFGIIYGISAFGLANQLGIAREEASAYIKKYFERFPGIRAYMDSTRDFCRTHGYVETLFGRKCHYPDIKASNASIRSFNERAAINARLQGTAADIIRRAMTRMEEALAEKKLSAQMLLQVHDELIFEVPDDEVAATLPVVQHTMQDAPFPACCSRCRCMSMRGRRIIGTRRIERSPLRGDCADKCSTLCCIRADLADHRDHAGTEHDLSGGAVADRTAFAPVFAAVAGIALGLIDLRRHRPRSGWPRLIDNSPLLYGLLRWTGVAYLLCSHGKPGRAIARPPLTSSMATYDRPWLAFRRGLITNLLNPKAAVFYVAVLRIFIRADGGPLVLQTLC